MNTEGLDLPPLHRAADEGDVGEIQRLISAGADVNASWTGCATMSSFRGLTPLMLAAGSAVGSPEAVQLLLDLGADPQAKSGAGATALWLAAEYSHSHNVAMLLNAGSDPLVETSNGRSALAVAAGADDADTVRLLLAAGALAEPTGIPPQRKNVLPSTPLSDWSFESMRKYYTDSWPSYAIPLFAAAESGGAKCISIILEAGANPNFLDDNGGSALMHATSSAVVEALIDAGCSLHTRDTFDRTAFSRALEYSEGADAAKALVRAGVDLEELDSHGRTVLLSLCGSYTIEIEMVRLLLDAGANIHATAPRFGTALHCAAQLCCGDRRGLLGDVIRLLVGSGLPVDSRDDCADTALHKAVGDEGVDLGAVEALLELGANPNASDIIGVTPLMTAASWVSNGNVPETIRLLLQHGGDPDLKNKIGLSARDHSAMSVKSWEKIVSNPAPAPANSFMPESYDREASHKEVLELSRLVLRILEDAVAERSVSA